MKQVVRIAAAAALLLAVVGRGAARQMKRLHPPQQAVPGVESSSSSAAASLKKSFTDIGEQFKTDNLGTDVEFSFAGSSDLVTQLTQGAPADVFASADTKNMDKAAQAGLLAGDPINFASNTLTIVATPAIRRRSPPSGT